MLVLFSGGVESTALMKYYLTETQEPVTACHIYCPNRLSNRAHLEWKAVTDLLPHLQAMRSFTFHRIDLNFPFVVRDSEVQVSVLPALLRHTGEKSFVRGLCLEDWHDAAGYRGPEMNEHCSCPLWSTNGGDGFEVPVVRWQWLPNTEPPSGNNVAGTQSLRAADDVS